LPFLLSGNLFVRRATFLAFGGWDETLSYCEDVDFSWRAQLEGATLGFVPRAVIFYRFRPSTKALFHQMRRYHAAEVQLFVRYRSAGARRRSPGEVLGRLWWLLSRSPYIVLGVERRSLWWSIAGTMVGRIHGSFRHRVVYL
jgi:GT2 family glycosyltransferase